MKQLNDIIVVCNTKQEYIDCYIKAKIEYDPSDNFSIWTYKHEEEFKKYGFPIYLIIDKHLIDLSTPSVPFVVDWCIDKDCKECHCDCSIFKKISPKDYLENYRGSKLKRIIDGKES
jgi:hypothetical protein